MSTFIPQWSPFGLGVKRFKTYLVTWADQKFPEGRLQVGCTYCHLLRAWRRVPGVLDS